MAVMTGPHVRMSDGNAVRPVPTSRIVFGASLPMQRNTKANSTGRSLSRLSRCSATSRVTKNEPGQYAKARIVLVSVFIALEGTRGR